MEFREQWQCWFEFEHTSIGYFCFNCFSSYYGGPISTSGITGGVDVCLLRGIGYYNIDSGF